MRSAGQAAVLERDVDYRGRMAIVAEVGLASERPAASSHLRSREEEGDRWL